MRKSVLSILGVVGLIGFINCGELGAMHSWRRNSSQEYVDNSTNAVELLPTRNAETRQNANFDRLSFFNEERRSFLKEKLVNGCKWLGLGCVGLAEGLGRTLGIVCSGGICLFAIVEGLLTLGVNMRGTLAIINTGTELLDYAIYADSLTKRCMRKLGL